MSRTGLNRILLVVIVILVLMAWFVRRDFSRPNYVFTPEMVFSVPYDTYSANPVFADGKTLQLPVEGTIARGATMFEYEATEADALRAGEELTSPWTETGLDPKFLLEPRSRGRKVYSTFCLPCHGAVGNGDGPVSMHGFPPPPSLSAEHSLEMTDGQMFHVLTFGQKNMPAYAPQVSEADRWKAILHVRSLQKAAVQKIEADKLTQASIDLGQQVFQRLKCKNCHTVSAEEKPVGPFLGKVALAYTRAQLREAILHPSKTLAEGFLAEVFLMMDGRTHSGFITSETKEEIKIRNSDGNEIVLLVEDIDERRSLEKSPMPDGLLKELSDEELNSLLDYLKSLAVEPAENGDQETPNDKNEETETGNAGKDN